MEQEYIIIYKNCDIKNSGYKISLQDRIDYWSQDKINSISSTPFKITSISIGPKTVLEYYFQPNFIGNKYSIINSTNNQIRNLSFTCDSDNIKSFIIYSYDYYESLYKIKYCSSDNDCKVNEMCLCKKGQSHPSWCPKSKRRCMSSGYFTYEYPLNINNYKDKLDINCINEESKKLDGQTIVSNALINDLIRRCAKEKLDTIEGFSYYAKNDAWFALILIILIFIFLIIICKFVN